jgi:hypothetical protein
MTFELIGRRFGFWTVIDKARGGSEGKPLLWKCRCDCGNESLVGGTSLRSGRSTRCRSCHNRLASWKRWGKPMNFLVLDEGRDLYADAYGQGTAGEAKVLPLCPRRPKKPHAPFATAKRARAKSTRFMALCGKSRQWESEHREAAE